MTKQSDAIPFNALLVQNEWQIIEKAAEVIASDAALSDATHKRDASARIAERYREETSRIVEGGRVFDPVLLSWIGARARSNEKLSEELMTDVKTATAVLQTKVAELASLRKTQEHLQERVSALGKAEMAQRILDEAQDASDIWTHRRHISASR